MMINLDNAHSNPRNRIKLQPLTAITGAALALSGAIALGGWQGGSGAEVTDNTQPEAQEADAFEVIRKAFRDATGESITWVDLRGQSRSLAQEAGAGGTR